MAEKATANKLLEKLPQLSDNRLKWDYLNDVLFTQPMAVALGLVEDKELALRVVKLAFEIDSNLGAHLAGKVQEEWQEETVSLIDKLKVPPVLRIIILVKTQSSAAIPRLTKFLENEESNIVNTVIVGLANLNSENAINQLKPLLEDKSKSSYVRLIVARALLEKRSKLAVSTLLKLLTSTDYGVPREAASILSKCESERKKIITRLKKVLTYKNPDSLSIAAFLAGEIQCSEVVPRLIELTDIKEEYEYEDDDEDDEDDYEYEDEYQQVRENAITALGKIKTEPAIEKLLSIAEDKSRNSEIHCRAIFALRTIEPEAMFPHFIELIKDGYCDEYYYVFNFLEEIQTEVAIPLTNKLIESEDGFIRAVGVKILGKLKQKNSLAQIIKLAEDKDCDVRASVAEALGNFEIEAVNSTLISLLEDKFGDVRKKAAISLFDSHPDKAIPVLKSLLKDDNIYIREEAAETIGELKLETAIPELIPLLKDKYGNVRYQAVEALRILNAKSAIPELLPLLKDKCEEVVAVCAEALGELQAEEAIPILVKLLKSNDMFIRKSALQGLTQIKSEQTMIELNKLLQNKKFLQADNGSNYSDALDLLTNIQILLGYYKSVSSR